MIPAKKLMPYHYTPDGGPYFWRVEESGVLAAAVAAFLDKRPLHSLQVELLREYFQHWIDCPIWQQYPYEAESFRNLNFLRFDIQTIADSERLHCWYRTACALGIDPL